VCLFIYTISLIFSCVPCHFLKLTSLLLDLFNFFHDVSAFSHSPSFCPRIKPKFSPAGFLGDLRVCVLCFGFKKKTRSVTWMVLIVCAAALGSRAGNPHQRTCAPKEPPALASPGQPQSCCCECYVDIPDVDIYVVVCMGARALRT